MNDYKYPLIESFRWFIPDFKANPGAGRKVVIKGKALYAGTVSKNMRKYVSEELKRAARTFVGKPITINHDNNKIVGHIIDMEEENGELEYVGEVNQEPYVSRLLDKFNLLEQEYLDKWGMPPINGVSVDAKYRYNRCSRCGEHFVDLNVLNDHMWSVHEVKSNVTEPRGIFGEALSLVEPPEVPGVEGTTIELWETAGDMSRLLETVTKVYEEKKKMTSRMAVTREDRHLAFGRSERKPLTEQEEECPEGQHRNEEGECVDDEVSEQEECPEGQHRNEEGECVPDEVTEQEECPEGQHRNEEGECVDDEASEQEECPEGQHRGEDGECVPNEKAEEQENTECPENTHWDAEKEECVADAVEEQEEECPEGQHKNEDGECVDDAVVETAVPKITVPSLKRISLKTTKKETVELKELKLGEPFADYTDFADCVAKNSDKEDPEAYCASIKQEAGGETAPKLTGKFVQEQRDLESKQFREQTDKRYMTIRGIIKGYGKDLIGMKEAVSHLAEERLRIIEVSNKIIKTVNQLASRPDNTPTIMAELNRIAEQVNKMITPLTERMNDLPVRFDKQIATVTLKMTVNARAMEKTLEFLTAKIDAADVNTKRNHKKLAKEISSVHDASKRKDRELKETLSQIKTETFEKITAVDTKIGASDKTKAEIVGKLNEQYVAFKKESEEEIAALNIKLEEQTEKLKEKDEKTVKETQTMETRVDNLEDKLKDTSRYKGHVQFDKEKGEDKLDTKRPWKEEAE